MNSNLSRQLERFLDRLGWKDLNVTYLRKWTIISVFVGLLSGCTVILFYVSIQIISSFFLGYVIGYVPPPMGNVSASSNYSLFVERVWMIPLVMSGAGMVIGLITTKFAPETRSDGIDNVIEVFHSDKGLIRRRVAIIKPIISSLSIGTGGSGGPEGPMAQIASAFGSIVGKLFRLDDEETRIAIVSGMGAGIGSMIRVPFGGALFAIELLYGRDFMIKSLFPVLVASLTSYAVSGIYLGWSPILTIPQGMITKFTIESIAAYATLAAIVGISSIFYTRIIGVIRAYFEKIRIPSFLKPVIGCAMVGIFAIGFPEILGTGYGLLQIVIIGNYEFLPIWILIAIIFVKMFATSISVGSGGGISFFGPTLVIGGLIGAAVMSVFHLFGVFTFVDIPSATLISMFAFFAAGTKSPFSSIVMGTEIVGGYFLLVPLTISVLISYVISGKNTSIYKNNLAGFSVRKKNLNKKRSLYQFRVGDTMDPTFYDITKEAVINEAVRIMKETESTVMAVTNNEDKLEGIVHYRDLVETSEENKEIKTVEDVMIKDPPFLLPSDTLQKGLETMVTSGLSELFVVSPSDNRLVIGLISLDDISRMCNERKPILLDIESIDQSEIQETNNSFKKDSSVLERKISLTNKQIWSKLKDHWTI